MVGNILPTSIGNFSSLVQDHVAINNFPKQAFPVVGTNGNEIQSLPGVIVPFQSDAFSVMYVRVVSLHDIVWVKFTLQYRGFWI